jgi:hypothetical protein
MSFKVGDMVWVLNQHDQPMSPAQVEGETPEGLAVVRFLADDANRLRFPITPKRLHHRPDVRNMVHEPILIDSLRRLPVSEDMPE